MKNNQAVAATSAKQGATATKQKSRRGTKKPLAPLAINPGPLVPLYLPRPLEPGWVSVFDPKTCLPYYFHPSTKRSQWHAPLVPLPPLPPPWMEASEPTRGIPYYYNPLTKSSQWERPAGPSGGVGLPQKLAPVGVAAAPGTCTEAFSATDRPTLMDTFASTTTSATLNGPSSSTIQALIARYPKPHTSAVQTPSFQEPPVQTTTVQSPPFQIPGVQNPPVQILPVQTPTVQTSAVQNPTIHISALQLAEMQLPAVQLPTVQTSVVQTPTAQNPYDPQTPPEQIPVTQTSTLQTLTVQTPVLQTPAVHIPTPQSLLVQAPVHTAPVQTSAVQTPAIQPPAGQVPRLQTPPIRQSAVPAPSRTVAFENRIAQRFAAKAAARSALQAPVALAPFTADRIVSRFIASQPKYDRTVDPTTEVAANVGVYPKTPLAEAALPSVQVPIAPAPKSVADRVVSRSVASVPAYTGTSVPALPAAIETGVNTGVNAKTSPAEAEQGPIHIAQMEVAQGQPALVHPTAVDEPVGMLVEAGPDDLIESVADLPIPCLECACMGPVTRDGLCRTCAKLPITSSPTLIQISPVQKLPSDPPSKRARKRKPPLYTSPPPRASELASNGSPSFAQLPDEILESIVKMVAAAKPRSKTQTPYRAFMASSFKACDSEYELRVDERLAVRDLANLSRVAKDWNRGVEAVGWATLLDGIADTCYTGSDVRKGQKDGNAAVTLKGMHAASVTIVATKAAAEYKVKTEELRAQAKPFKVKRNPHRRSGQMRIYYVKDVLEIALAKHGGAVGLRAKIEKCEATARKRAANGGARPGRKPRGRAWPSHNWDSECDCDSEGYYDSDEFEDRWNFW